MILLYSYRWGKTTVDKNFLSRLLPGAVTLVFERTPALNEGLNPFTSHVGIRIPDHAFVRELARSCDGPLALTSANKSATKSSLNIKVICNCCIARHRNILKIPKPLFFHRNLKICGVILLLFLMEVHWGTQRNVVRDPQW